MRTSVAAPDHFAQPRSGSAEAPWHKQQFEGRHSVCAEAYNDSYTIVTTRFSELLGQVQVSDLCPTEWGQAPWSSFAVYVSLLRGCPVAVYVAQ